MSLLFYTHPSALEHHAGPGHPEAPVRLQAVLAAVEAAGLPGLRRVEPPEATLEQIRRVHPEPYPTRVLEAIPGRGLAAARCRHGGLAGLRRGGSAQCRCGLCRGRRRALGRGDLGRSARCGRPGIMPSPWRPWGSACSTMWPSGRCRPGTSTSWGGSRSSTSTCTTATAPRRSSGTIRTRSTSRRTSRRSIPAPAVPPSAASRAIS